MSVVLLKKKVKMRLKDAILDKDVLLLILT